MKTIRSKHNLASFYSCSAVSAVTHHALVPSVRSSLNISICWKFSSLFCRQVNVLFPSTAHKNVHSSANVSISMNSSFCSGTISTEYANAFKVIERDMQKHSSSANNMNMHNEIRIYMGEGKLRKQPSYDEKFFFLSWFSRLVNFLFVCFLFMHCAESAKLVEGLINTNIGHILVTLLCSTLIVNWN